MTDIYGYRTYPVAYRVNATSKQRYAQSFDVDLRRMTDAELRALHNRAGGRGIGDYIDRDGNVWQLDLAYTQSDHARNAADEIAAYDPTAARFLRVLADDLKAAGS